MPLSIASIVSSKSEVAAMRPIDAQLRKIHAHRLPSGGGTSTAMGLDQL